MALRSIRKAFAFRSKTDLSASDVSSSIENPPPPSTPIARSIPPTPPPPQHVPIPIPIIPVQRPEITCNHDHRARDEEMQVLRDMNVALKVQLTEALERIAELQLESISISNTSAASLANPATVPATVPIPQVHRCCIDLEPFKRGDTVMRLPCFHVHHKDCLLPYLKNQEAPECPECRTPVPVDDLDNLPIWQWVPPNNGAAASST